MGDVLAAVPTWPERPESAAVIHQRVGYNAATSCRHALDELTRDGLALRVRSAFEKSRPGSYHWLYWRTDGWVR